ncbi:MAG: Flagellar protein FliT [Proteobacteria bacterium]|nr:Flagellar protein FliT [Pseudomonadota bacterium]
MALLESYQSLLSLSERMVEMAREQDWDNLVALENERTVLSAKLPPSLATLQPNETPAIADAIKRILECNGVIQEHVEPWMAQVSTLLAAFSPKA